MKFHEYLKDILLNTIKEMAKNPTLYAKNPGRDFTRNRKLGFKQFIQMLLTLEGECLREEIYLFCGRTTDAPTKAAFYKQRQKLRKDAIANLLFAFNAKLKRKLYNSKYQLIAIDGSTLDIFRNPDDTDSYFPPNKKTSIGFNQVHFNAAYSILDERFTDVVVQPGRKRNEYEAFCQLVDNASNTTKSKNPIIYICDRGYASYNDYAHVIENNQYFVIRCNDTRLSTMLGYPVKDLTTLDLSIERILSRSQSKKKRLQPNREDDYRHICKSVTFDYINDANPEYTIALRVIRFELSNGIYENLITNLPAHEFNTDDFKELYNLRLREENAFRTIKYTLKMKAFHSKKYDYIVQEIWARCILYNFCSEINKNTQIPDKTGLKHRYQINYSEANKICRDFLRLPKGKTMDAMALIIKNLEPVRQGRKYKIVHRSMHPISFVYR